MNRLLLDALQGINAARPPVWIMRQAGRYLPEYQTLRRRYSLDELLRCPELAAEITRMPLQTLGVDAAILFSDILLLWEAFGCEVRFPDTGPTVRVPCHPSLLQPGQVRQALAHVQTTIALLKPTLHVPLIGFCGAPFTLASFLLDAPPRGEFAHTRNWLVHHRVELLELLTKLSDGCIEYLRMQIEAGVDAVQIFESSSHLLSEEQFALFSLPYLQRIIDGVKDLKVAVILFCRNASCHARELAALQPTCISFDSGQPMHALALQLPPPIALQGNIDPQQLLASCQEVVAHTQALLDSMRGSSRFIVNLGHGVLPHTPLQHVQVFVETVRSYAPTI